MRDRVIGRLRLDDDNGYVVVQCAEDVLARCINVTTLTSDGCSTIETYGLGELDKAVASYLDWVRLMTEK